MAAPNIINLTTITGKTNLATVTTVSTNVLVNLAASGQVFKVNTVLATNIDPANASDVTLSLFRAGAETKMANAVVIPAKAAMAVISRDTQFYMEEGDALRMSAVANSDIVATISYEIMS